MKKLLKKKFLKWYILAGLLAILFLLPLGAYWYMNCFMLTPQKLKTMLKTEVANTIRGDFDCNSIQLTYWETWPTISFSIEGGKFKSPNADLQIDFDKLYVYVNILDYFANKELSVDKIVVKHPNISLQTAEGTNPFDLLKERKSERNGLETLNLMVEEGNLQWTDTTHQLHSQCDQVNLHLESDFKTMDLALQSDSIFFEDTKHGIDCHFPLQLNLAVALAPSKNEVTIKSATAHIANLPFDVIGDFRFNPEENLWIDIALNLQTSQLAELTAYLPSSYQKVLSDYQLKGSTSLQGKIKGHIGEKVSPDFTLCGQIKEGSVVYKNKPDGLERISTDFILVYPSNAPDSTYIEMKDLNVSGLNSALTAQVKIQHLLTKPFIDMQLKSSLNLSRMGQEFFNPQTIQLSGDLTTDLSMVFKLDDLKKGHYDRIWANGSLEVNHLSLTSDAYHFSAFAQNAKGSIGYKENKSHFIRQREVLGASLHADTLSLRCKPNIQLAVADLNVSSNTGLQLQADAMTPVTSHLRVRKAQAKLTNDMAILLSNTDFHLGIKPSDHTKGQINIATALKSDSLEYLNIKEQQAAKVIQTEFASELSFNSKTSRLNLLNFSNDFHLSNMKGYVIFDYLHTFAKQFPLHIRMHDTQFGFKNNHLVLNKSQLQLGHSEASVSGILESKAQPGKRRPYLSGKLNVQSKYLNLSELKKAYLYKQNQQKTKRESDDNMARLLNIENLNESLKALESRTDSLGKTTNQLLKVPGNCNLVINLNADQVDMRNVCMEKVSGQVRLKDEKAMIDFSTHTNVGNLHGNLSYKYRNTDRADVYFDCKTSQIHVGKINQIFPEIRSLFPPITDMNGILDMQIVSTFPLNSRMEIHLPSLYATCSLEGSNMVLLSNELYQQISKKFRFKNEDSNIIRHLAVDCIAKDSKIEILPFQLDMDRYSLLIGGQHNMDMNYSYHIDVIKSIIPIDFGLHVTGNMEKYKLNMEKMKYRSMFNDPFRFQEFKMGKLRTINENQARIMKQAEAF